MVLHLALTWHIDFEAASSWEVLPDSQRATLAQPHLLLGDPPPVQQARKAPLCARAESLVERHHRICNLQDRDVPLLAAAASAPCLCNTAAAPSSQLQMGFSRGASSNRSLCPP